MRDSKANKIWLYGKHSCKSALLNRKRQIYKILISKNNQKDFELFWQKNKLSFARSIISIVDSKEISAKFNNEVVHQGFAILCSKLILQNDNEFLSDLEKSPKQFSKILILDQLSDPHNIGAIIRSSVAFGIKDIIIHGQSFSGETAIISKISCGALEKANIVVAQNVSNFIVKLKNFGYWVAGLDGSGNDNFATLNDYNKICLVVGSECDGIRSLVKKKCDFLVKIPISSDVESLNASNAAAIALYEITAIRV